MKLEDIDWKEFSTNVRNLGEAVGRSWDEVSRVAVEAAKVLRKLSDEMSYYYPAIEKKCGKKDIANDTTK